MSAAANKIALFIDGANLYATCKTLGFDIDYKRLLKEFQSYGTLVRAFYYTAVIEVQEFSSVRPLLDWLDYNGYSVVTKATKEFIDANGHRKVKGNMDIELAVDAMELAEHVDQIVLFSGDGDFRLAGRSGAAPRRPGHRRVDDFEPAADGRRRAAAPGRRVHRSDRASGEDRSRSGGPSGTPRAASSRTVVPGAFDCLGSSR